MLGGNISRSWSGPSGTTPQSANADSSPFRGAKGIAGYNIRYRKPMPPLKGRGGPRSGGEVRPRRQRLPIPQPTHAQQKGLSQNDFSKSLNRSLSSRQTKKQNVSSRISEMRYTTATFSLQNACLGTPKPVNCIRRMQADVPKKLV